MKSGILPQNVELWRRRLPFVCVNILFLIIIILGVVAPLLRLLLDGEESLSERRATLSRYEAVGAQEGAVREYVRQVKESNTHGDLLEGATTGVVAAALQSRLKAMAETSGVTVRSIQALPSRTLGASGLAAAGAPHAAENAPQLVGARVEVAGSPGAIHNFARAIESGPPMLVTTAASMSQQMMIWRPIGSEEQPPEIAAQFDVYGGAPAKDRP